MLEPIREYALEQLVARGEEKMVRHAHATYYLVLAETAAAQWDSPTAEVAIAQLDREYDNVRAALHWARDGGESTLGLQLAGALWRFWRIRGYYSEGRVWLEELLALDEHPSDATALAARLHALEGAAWLASQQTDYVRATQLFEQSVALHRALGETRGEAQLLGNAAFQARAAGQYGRATALWEDAVARHRALGDRGGIGSGGLGQALYGLGLVLREQGDFAGAAVMFEECIAFHRTLGDGEGMAVGLLGLGDIARDQGDAAQLRRYCEESLALLRKLGVQWAIGCALNNLALGAYQEGDLTRAFALASESVVLFRDLQADASVAEVLITLGQILHAQGDAAAAYAALTEALRLAQAVGLRLLVAAALEGLASVVVAQRQAELAARLLAAASVLRVQMGTPIRPVDQAGVEQMLATARSRLGDAFAPVWAEAQTRPFEQILSTIPSMAAQMVVVSLYPRVHPHVLTCQFLWQSLPWAFGRKTSLTTSSALSTSRMLNDVWCLINRPSMCCTVRSSVTLAPRGDPQAQGHRAW